MIHPSNAPASATALPPATVLVVGRDPAVVRELDPARHVPSVTDATRAQRALERLDYDVVVVEIDATSGADALDLVEHARRRDPSLPVILVAAEPTIESAVQAVAMGAFRYMTAPVAAGALGDAIDAALRSRTIARCREPSASRIELERALESALASLHMVYQPIVSAETREVFGFEALMRCREPALPTPPAVLDAAERLGRLHDVGRRVRALVATQLEASRGVECVFVNLHAADLADAELFSPDAPLSRSSHRVILEITERASLDGIVDPDERIAALRALGYRIAIDDLGAGYAGLSAFARLRPDIAKIDMSLVRGIDGDPVRQKVVHSLSSLASALGARVVAEGVETTAERDAVVRLGCSYLQGYALARPGPPFPAPRWDPSPGAPA